MKTKAQKRTEAKMNAEKEKANRKAVRMGKSSTTSSVPNQKGKSAVPQIKKK